MEDQRIEIIPEKKEREYARRSNSWYQLAPHGENRIPFWIIFYGLIAVFIIFLISVACYCAEYDQQIQARAAIVLSWVSVGVALFFLLCLIFRFIVTYHFFTSFSSIFTVFVSWCLFFIYNALKTQAIPNSIFYSTLTMRVAVVFGWLGQCVYTLLFLYIVWRLVHFLNVSTHQSGMVADQQQLAAASGDDKERAEKSARRINELEDRNKALQAQYNEVVTKHNTIVEKNAAANDNSAKTKQAHDDLVGKYAALNEQNQDQAKEIGQLKRQVQLLQSAQSGNSDEQTRAHQDTLQKLAAAENAAHKSKNDADRANAENARLQAELAEARKQTNSTLSAFQAENAKDDQQIYALKQDIAAKQDRINQLQAADARQQRQIADLTDELNRVRAAGAPASSPTARDRAKAELIAQAKAKWDTLKPRFGCEFEDASALSPRDADANHADGRDSNGARIIKVVDEGPMEDAGIIVADVMKYVHGVKVQGREHFKQLLINYKPLEIVSIDFKRGDDIHHTKVEVGAQGTSAAQLKAIQRIALYEQVNDDDIRKPPF